MSGGTTPVNERPKPFDVPPPSSPSLNQLADPAQTAANPTPLDTFVVIPDAVSSPEAHGMVYGAPARQGLRQRILAAATAPVTPAEPMQWGTGDVKRSTFSESAYEDFDTIDWIRDQMNDRVHRASVDAKANQKGASIFLKVARAFYRVQAWILLTIVAVFTGIIAAVIDVSVDFLEDTRVGFCQDDWLASRNVCCQGTFEGELCASWTTWSEFVGVQGIGAHYLIDICMYASMGTLFTFVVAFLVKNLAPWARGSGIPEMKTVLTGFVIKQSCSIQTLIVKVLGLVLAVSSGLNVGKEGPLIHVACCVCSVCCYAFPKFRANEAKKREMLSAAVAAGVAVAFGAPIGGVLFSLEEGNWASLSFSKLIWHTSVTNRAQVSYFFPHKTMWRALFTATMAAITLQFLNPFGNGKSVLFEVSYSHSWLTFELIPFIFLGLLGGILGVLFIKLNMLFNNIRKESVVWQWPVLEACIVTLLTALVSYNNDYLRGNISSVVGELFAECTEDSFGPLCNVNTAWEEIVILLLATALRFCLTVFTLGVAVPAGGFMPSLAIGASLGHAVGLMMMIWQTSNPDFFLFRQCAGLADCVDPGVYALVGAAAMLAGVTRMTVSLVVIILELTGDFTNILPIMITVVVAKWVADAIQRDGIYEHQILQREYPFLDNKRDYKFCSLARDIMRADPVVLELRPYTLMDLQQFTEKNMFSGWPIVTNKRKMFLAGFVARTELRQALEIASQHPLVNASTLCYFFEDGSRGNDVYIDLRPWLDRSPMQVSEDTPLNSVYDLFKKMGLRYILVSNRGRLAGIVTKKDILQHIAITFYGKFRSFVVPEFELNQDDDLH